MRKNPTYMAYLRPTRLLISEKSATYTIKWSYTIIWKVRVGADDFKKVILDRVDEIYEFPLSKISSLQCTPVCPFLKSFPASVCLAFAYWKKLQIQN